MATGLIVMAWIVSPLAQQPTFRSDIELVSVNVSVIDGANRHVTGLTVDKFEVFEDGVRQSLQFFAPGDLPIDVVVLLDTSASMSPSMPLVQQAATQFVRTLRPTDRVTVMGISNGLRVLQPLTSDMAAAMRAITATRAAGRTALYVSIYTALAELRKAREQGSDEPRRQAIVVLSDGVDTASAFGFAELLDSVRRQGVPIYPIAPRQPKAVEALREISFGESTHGQDFELRRLARETGARAFFPVSLEDLRGVYADIARELWNQYSLGYQSTNDKPDGAFRQIALRVAAPGVTWRARTGYIADASAGNGEDDQ
jgi:Ca-activated chloride channel family protein